MLQAEIIHTLSRPCFVGMKNVFSYLAMGTTIPPDKGHVYLWPHEGRWVHAKIESRSVFASFFMVFARRYYGWRYYLPEYIFTKKVRAYLANFTSAVILRNCCAIYYAIICDINKIGCRFNLLVLFKNLLDFLKKIYSDFANYVSKHLEIFSFTKKEENTFHNLYNDLSLHFGVLRYFRKIRRRGRLTQKKLAEIVSSR